MASQETNNNSEQIDNQKKKKTLSPFAAIIAAILGVALAYFAISMLLGMTFGTKLPDPFYNDQPFATGLKDPSYPSSPSLTENNVKVDPKTLQKLLENHPYSQDYEVNVFDCSDMSVELAKYLQEEKGYDTSVIGDDLNVHAWVYVWTGENEAWAIEVTGQSSLMRGSAGEVIGDDPWDYLFAFKNLLNPVTWTEGGPKEFYYPTEQREGEHIREWNDVEAGR